MLQLKTFTRLFIFLAFFTLAITPISTDARFADPTLSVVVYEDSSPENVAQFIVNVTTIGAVDVDIDQVLIFRYEGNERFVYRSNALAPCNSSNSLPKPKPVTIPPFEQHEFLWDGLSDDCQTPSPGLYEVWPGRLRGKCKDCSNSNLLYTQRDTYYMQVGGFFTIE